MNRRPIQYVLFALVLAATVGGAWLVTNSFQRTVSLGGGINRCWVLEGGSRQVACLSDRLEQNAAKATKGLSGPARDEALVGYVRSTELAAGEDSRLAANCHPAMHQLGRAEGKRYARASRPPTFPEGASQRCTAGYVHGLAEGYLTGTADADVAAVFPALCHETKAREGCAHGVGHALLRAHVDEPALAASRAATTRCQELPGEFPTNCMNGVYMELAMRVEPRPVSPADYLETCTGTADVERSLACWGYMSTNLSTNDVPLADVPSWCAKADLPGRFPCIEEYGRSLGYEQVAQCDSSAEMRQLRERCVDGAMGVQVGSGHVTKQEATQACGTIDSSRLRMYCEDAVGRYAKGRTAVEKA